jgi:hypothetical protein
MYMMGERSSNLFITAMILSWWSFDCSSRPWLTEVNTSGIGHELPPRIHLLTNLRPGERQEAGMAAHHSLQGPILPLLGRLHDGLIMVPHLMGNVGPYPSSRTSSLLSNPGYVEIGDEEIQLHLPVLPGGVILCVLVILTIPILTSFQAGIILNPLKVTSL